MGLELIIALGVAGFGYVRTRKFVRERLRFVDAVRKPVVPVVVGVGTAVLVGLVVNVVPVLGALTAITAGVGIGAGVSSGAKDTRRLPAP